ARTVRRGKSSAASNGQECDGIKEAHTHAANNGKTSRRNTVKVLINRAGGSHPSQLGPSSHLGRECFFLTRRSARHPSRRQHDRVGGDGIYGAAVTPAE